MILICLSSSTRVKKNAVERIKPYYRFFSEKIGISVDMIVARKEEIGDYEGLLRGSILLA